jgi:pimeloyl-ACP methyl ester carboxylesterase
MLTTHTPTTTSTSTGRWAGLAGRAHGDLDATKRPLVLLHGLTFDHHLWDPVMDALPSDHPALALDLPGHGDSRKLPSHGLETVAGAVHDAVASAGLPDPILVGHSLAAGVAAVYADRHGAAGIVNVDSSWRLEPFLHLLRQLEAHLRGDGFPQTWELFRDSMHLSLVPPAYWPLLAAGDDVPAELVLSYWEHLLNRSVPDTLRDFDDMFARARDLPYLALFGAELDDGDRAWMLDRLPQGELVVWPVGHHFPHLHDPVRFAELITAFTAALPTPR